MLKMALRQAVELGSFERAADNFSELDWCGDLSQQVEAAGVDVWGGGGEGRRGRKRLCGGGNRRRTARCWWYRLMG